MCIFYLESECTGTADLQRTHQRRKRVEGPAPLQTLCRLAAQGQPVPLWHRRKTCSQVKLQEIWRTKSILCSCTMTAVWPNQIKLHFNAAQNPCVPLRATRVCLLKMCAVSGCVYAAPQQHSMKHLNKQQKLYDHLFSAALQRSDSGERGIFRRGRNN